jgi:hypothetical protein
VKLLSGAADAKLNVGGGLKMTHCRYGCPQSSPDTLGNRRAVGRETKGDR